MVTGLDVFQRHFSPYPGAFTLIGGAACDVWFERNGLSFRSTRDLDLVLMIEVLDRSLVSAIRAFVTEGGYTVQERSDGTPVLYRFAKPARPDFPAKLEFCSRDPGNLALATDQAYIPIPTGPGAHSLSAILLDADYYELLKAHHVDVDGLRVANATSLIPLKAHAWLNLTRLKADGEAVDARDIDKHRNDVFRLAATLPAQPGPELPARITTDLSTFLRKFPANSPEWPGIQAALKATVGVRPAPDQLLGTLATHFRLTMP